MEISMSSIVGAIVFVTLVTWTMKMVNWVWFRPKKLERFLRRQGLKGNPYRILHGDLKEISMMRKEANSKPINLSDDIFPRLDPFLSHSIEKYGKDVFIWFGPTPMMTIMDPEEIKEALIKFGDFQKPASNPLLKMLANGLSNHEGEKWARHRKIINPSFHVEKLKLMLPAFSLGCREMINKWKDSVSAETGSCELDVWPSILDMAGDVLSRTAFGSSYEEGRTIIQLQQEQSELANKALQSLYIPGWIYVPTKMNNRMKKIEKTVQSLIREIINKRERAMKAGEAAKDDLLGILLESNRKEIQDHNNNNKKNKNVGMSIADVVEECKLFYLVGRETTSVLLSWTMVLLSQNPAWQDRARAEVLQVFKDKNPDYERLNHLKIMTMILNEVLRLYPSLPFLLRTVHKDTKLGKFTIPAGALIALSIIHAHHDQNLWGNDAKEFKPERFAEGISKATKNRGSFVPFSWGPRICIGQNFAMVEVKLALAMILQHFWFELSPTYAHAPFNAVSLRLQHGLNLVLHKR